MGLRTVRLDDETEKVRGVLVLRDEVGRTSQQ